jgi:hypothetical protein
MSPRTELTYKNNPMRGETMIQQKRRRRAVARLSGGEFAILEVQVRHVGGRAYFSITGDLYGPDRTLQSSGAITGGRGAETGDPALILAAALHLADARTGIPMHAEANARYHYERGDLAAAAHTLRVEVDDLPPLWQPPGEARTYANHPFAWRRFVASQRHRWAREAAELRAWIAGPDDESDPLEPSYDPDDPPDEIDFPHDDVIDSREIARITRSDDETFSAEILEELEEAEGYSGEWDEGATLIADSYFEDYAREFADDIGAVKDDAGWPGSHIDWTAAAAELKQDYTAVEIDGRTYWIR